MKLFTILSRILATGTFGHNTETGNTVPQGGDFVVQVCSVSLLNHIMSGLLHRLVAILLLVVVILRVGGRLALSGRFRRSIGRVRR
jgi:hypothetical protein